MPIKIAVDARMLSRPLNGMGRYTLKTCSKLLKINGISLYLYSPAPLLVQYLSDLEGAFIKTSHINARLLQHLWGEMVLPSWAKKDKVDIFWGPSHRIPRLLSKDIPRVVTIHDLVWKYARSSMPPISYFLERLQMPFAINNSDHIVTVSQATAQSVNGEFSINPKRLTVTHLGAELHHTPDAFNSLHTLGIHSSYCLFVGTLEPRKNLSHLLSAYATLPDDHKQGKKLVIAGGDGWGNIDLANLITRFHLEPHVILTGHVGEQTLATLYAHADFIVMPSIYEGFGLPLVEAMGYGTPVLTSNNSSMPEVAGDAGLFVDAEDIQSITDGLHQMISNTRLRDTLALNAKPNASRFNWDDCAAQLYTVFMSVISDRHNKR